MDKHTDKLGIRWVVWMCKNSGNMWRLKYFCKKIFRAKNNNIPFLVNTIEKEIALYAHVCGMKFLLTVMEISGGKNEKYP